MCCHLVRLSVLPVHLSFRLRPVCSRPPQYLLGLLWSSLHTFVQGHPYCRQESRARLYVVFQTDPEPSGRYWLGPALGRKQANAFFAVTSHAYILRLVLTVLSRSSVRPCIESHLTGTE